MRASSAITHVLELMATRHRRIEQLNGLRMIVLA